MNPEDMLSAGFNSTGSPSCPRLRRDHGHVRGGLLPQRRCPSTSGSRGAPQSGWLTRGRTSSRFLILRRTTRVSCSAMTLS